MACTRGCCATPQEHWRSVAVSAHATPTRRPDVVRVDETEKQWDRDGESYRRLRKDGLQPNHIDGSADFERRS